MTTDDSQKHQKTLLATLENIHQRWQPSHNTPSTRHAQMKNIPHKFEKIFHSADKYPSQKLSKPHLLTSFEPAATDNNKCGEDLVANRKVLETFPKIFFVVQMLHKYKYVQ